MKLLGEKIFARDAEGNLVSRIGTIFFRTPGLVTQRGVHAMQRIAWIEEIQRELGRELTPEEAEAEIAESVDLVFTEEHVLIRPNPERMDLAFRADDELQRLVPKINIRFLNTSSALVRKALRERGENWRMARAPISQDDMAELIANSKVPVGERPIYYYNRTTGTRFLTAETLARLESLAPDDFRRQMAEIVRCLGKRNRQGYPEVDVFPPTMPIEIKRSLQPLKPEEAPVEELHAEAAAIIRRWRMALPSELRDESPDNFEWRNAMCQTLTRGPNETAAVEQELVGHRFPVDHQRGTELEGIDDLFAFPLRLVRGSQVRTGLQHVEVALLVDQEDVQVGFHGVPVQGALPQDEGVAGKPGEEIPVGGQDRVELLRDALGFDPGVGVEGLGTGREGGTDLGGIADGDIRVVVDRAPVGAALHPVVFHADGRILVDFDVSRIGELGQPRTALVDIHGEGAELVRVVLRDIEVGGALRKLGMRRRRGRRRFRRRRGFRGGRRFFRRRGRGLRRDVRRGFGQRAGSGGQEDQQESGQDREDLFHVQNSVAHSEK